MPKITPDEEKRLWVYRNRGTLKRIADQFEVSATWVSNVLYGSKGAHSKDLRVERALFDAGAPHMADRLEKSA